MPFPPDVKARMFVRSARICPLCYKQCGTNIEAAHLVAEADGGSNEDDNGIPLCFDCHQEIGAYDNRHPKGNKFSINELKARRNQLYDLVEKGSIQAQIIAQGLHGRTYGNLRHETAAELASDLAEEPFKPSREALSVLQQAQTQWGSVEAFARKLMLLEKRDRAFVLDSLVESFDSDPAVRSLMAVITNGAFASEATVLTEQLLRRVTLAGEVEDKARFMRLAPVAVLENTDPALRATFFHDVIDIMRRDQYKEVNLITPAVVKVQSAIPQEIRGDYMKALLSQADSGAYDGAPAARGALRTIPAEFARIGLEGLEDRALLSMDATSLKEFVANHPSLWDPARKEIFQDFVSMDHFHFVQKYWTQLK